MSRILEVIPIKEASQAFTAGWKDYGEEQNGESIAGVKLNIEMLIGGSTAPQFKIVTMHTSGGTEFDLPLATPSASKYSIQPFLQELPASDQNQSIGFVFQHQCKFWKVKIKDAGAGGGTVESIVAEAKTI